MAAMGRINYSYLGNPVWNLQDKKLGCGFSFNLCIFCIYYCITKIF